MQLTTHAIFDGPQTFGMKIRFMHKRVVTTMHSSELAQAAG